MTTIARELLTGTTPEELPLNVLQAQLSGRVIIPGDADYDDARRVPITSFYEHPQVIVRAASAEDVAAAVRFAREHGLRIAVRSGGHSVAGYSVVDGSLVIDLSQMKAVSIHPASRTARVQPGATSGDIAPAAQQYGLAVSTGDAASVGIGGLATGGGIGWMVRKFGLTIDAIVGVEVVTAEGEIIQATADEHADLFWAVRGGGGNFGIVTAFELRLQPVGMVLGGIIALPPTREVLRGLMDYVVRAPEELTTIAQVMHLPPAPFVSPEFHGNLAVIVFVCWAGEVEAGQRALQPIRALAAPFVDMVQPMPYEAMFELTREATLPHSVAIRSMYLREFPDAVIDTTLAHMPKATSPIAMFQIRGLGGAFARVPSDATAFAHRDKQYMATIINLWEGDDVTGAHHAWTQAFWEDIRAYGDGAYVNFLQDEGADRIRDAYPQGTYERLAEVKRRYDPQNVFNLNQNIAPK
ncbi:MAG TPA: FAD-binding oxidoreductase [Dehalococcoidia bacterium]|nr:FAD-binding oxidoreductase [Dehalococcoidia bacterium]